MGSLDAFLHIISETNWIKSLELIWGSITLAHHEGTHWNDLSVGIPDAL